MDTAAGRKNFKPPATPKGIGDSASWAPGGVASGQGAAAPNAVVSFDIGQRPVGTVKMRGTPRAQPASPLALENHETRPRGTACPPVSDKHMRILAVSVSAIPVISRVGRAVEQRGAGGNKWPCSMTVPEQ